MNEFKKMKVAVFAACALTLAVAGCDRRESTADTNADIAKAQAESAKDVANARADAAKSTIGAQKKVDEANAALDTQTVVAQRDVTVAEAEAANKVAIQKCEALTNDQRDACKKQADADLDTAKANAKSVARAADPKQ